MTSKKPTSLAEQVRQAQQAVSTWSEVKRSSLHLEGVDTYLSRKPSSSDQRQAFSAQRHQRKIAA